MNKLFYAFIAVLFLATSCTKEQLIKNLVGTFKLNSYIQNNVDKTAEFKASHQDYSLKFEESNLFTESYLLNGQVYSQITGEWQLINSNKDIQLVDKSSIGSATSTSVRMFNIKKIDKNNLTLTKGNEEYQFSK
ncbi:MAG: hypothetical protein M9931_06290 [Chitinophagales bacterium]|nr:hypothetical protein [Chitinophagales bacterium]MCO5280651.1 hypothetical protein [Chitinophagales bacterium]OJV29272.1 MAG: hypothetical protein BGO32_06960 [Bacteroidetes bacterium 37-13]HRN94729.1 hypothetical protein [Chitinophagales bacterium]HRP39229.1 hypothetical protein [Chitinophagales bacterium]